MDFLALMLTAINIFGATAMAEDCPPRFYVSLPRDNEWHYGAGKGIDAEKAREDALQNLGKQVTGNLQDSDIEKIVGPEQDRTAVRQEVADLLPTVQGALQGWEQDDRAQCKDGFYALVRVRQEQVSQFVRENKQFREKVLEGLAQQLKALQGSMPEILKRLDALERSNTEKDIAIAKLQESKQSGGAGEQFAEAQIDLKRRIADIRSGIAHKRPPAEVAKKLIAAEGAYKQIVERMQQYDQRREQLIAENAAKATSQREVKITKKSLRMHRMMSSEPTKYWLLKMYYGLRFRWRYRQQYGYFPSSKSAESAHCRDIRYVMQFDLDNENFKELRDFCRDVVAKLNGSEKDTGCAGVRDEAAAELVQASLLLGDRDTLLKDGEAYMKEFPTATFPPSLGRC